jgi:hypothetical protein
VVANHRYAQAVKDIETSHSTSRGGIWGLLPSSSANQVDRDSNHGTVNSIFEHVRQVVETGSSIFDGALSDVTTVFSNSQMGRLMVLLWQSVHLLNSWPTALKVTPANQQVLDTIKTNAAAIINGQDEASTKPLSIRKLRSAINRVDRKLHVAKVEAVKQLGTGGYYLGFDSIAHALAAARTGTVADDADDADSDSDSNDDDATVPDVSSFLSHPIPQINDSEDLQLDAQEMPAQGIHTQLTIDHEDSVESYSSASTVERIAQRQTAVRQHHLLQCEISGLQQRIEEYERKLAEEPALPDPEAKSQMDDRDKHDCVLDAQSAVSRTMLYRARRTQLETITQGLPDISSVLTLPTYATFLPKQL